LVLRALLGQLVTRAQMERMVSLAHKVLVVIVVPRVFVVLLDLLDLKVSKERRGKKDVQGHVVNKEYKVLRVTLATVDRRVLVVVVLLGPRAHKESKVPRENVEKLGHVQEAPLVLWDPRVSAAKWANKVRRAILVHLARKASVVAMVSRAIKVLLAPWVAQGFEVPRAIVVCKVLKATLVSRVQRVTRVMSAFAGHQAQEVSQAPLEHKDHLANVVRSGLSVAVVLRARRAHLVRWDLVAPRATKVTED